MRKREKEVNGQGKEHSLQFNTDQFTGENQKQTSHTSQILAYTHIKHYTTDSRSRSRSLFAASGALSPLVPSWLLVRGTCSSPPRSSTDAVGRAASGRAPLPPTGGGDAVTRETSETSEPESASVPAGGVPPSPRRMAASGASGVNDASGTGDDPRRALACCPVAAR